VILQSELAIGFRNFVLRRGLLYVENFVVTSFRGHVQARDEKVGASDAPKLVLLGDRQNEKYRRMGPMSRPLAHSGQWSQTTTGITQPAARLRKKGALAEC